MSKALELMVKGFISEMSVEDQKRIKDCKEMLKAIVKDNDDCGVFAITLAAIELEQEK